MAPLEGPVGVGALVDAIMLGCLIVQSCVYYRNARRDALYFNAVVLLILLLLLSHLGCMAAWLWASAEVSTRGASVPNYAPTVFGISSVCGATIMFVERCFFSHRIMKASNNHFLAFVFFVFCIFSFTAALGAACVFFTDPTAGLTEELSTSWVFPLVFVFGLVCDLAINIATAFCLRSEMWTEDVVDVLGRVTRLFFLAAETSVVTSLSGIAAVIVYWLTKTNLAWVGLFACLPGVFANALLVALNARGRVCAAEIDHRRASFKTIDKLVGDRPRRPPIMVLISTQAKTQSEKIPV